MAVPNIVWILPRPRRHRYKGGFPLYFEKKLIELLRPSGLILHPFAGMAEYGIRVDIDPNVEPDIVADAHHLPFKDNIFGMVVCDPPYDEEHASKLYKSKSAKYSQYISEAVRVCKVGGYVVSYHWALTPRPSQTSYYCRIFIAGRVWHRPRVACIFQKESDENVLLRGRHQPDIATQDFLKNPRNIDELLPLLACPLCKLELTLETKEGTQFLFCSSCSSSYPIKDGRPFLLPSEKRHKK